MAMLRGCDYSFDGDAAAVKKAGMAFAIAEVSIGTSENPTGARNIAAFRASGLAAGAYHYAIYAHADGTPTDPLAQAAFLAGILGKLPALDMPVWVDVEQPRSKSDLNLPMPEDAIVAWLEAFVSELERLTSRTPGIYIYPAYAKMLGAALKNSKLGRCPLWIADYSHGEVPPDGAVPVVLDPRSQWFLGGPWTSYALIQTRGNAQVTGIPHVVDTDASPLSLDDLADLGRQAAGPGGAPSSSAPVTVSRLGILAGVIAAASAIVWAWLRRR